MAAKKKKSPPNLAVNFNATQLSRPLTFSNFRAYTASDLQFGILLWWVCPETKLESTVGNILFKLSALKESEESWGQFLSRGQVDLEELPEMDDHVPRALDFGPPSSVDMMSFANYGGVAEMSVAHFSYKAFLETSRDNPEAESITGSGLTTFRAHHTVMLSLIDNLLQLSKVDA